MWASFATAQNTSVGSSDPAQTVRDFLVPFSSGDRAAFMTFFADDATVFLPEDDRFPPGRVRGQGDIEKAFSVLAPPQPRGPGSVIQPRDLEVQEFGSAAVVTFRLPRGRRTLVLRREGVRWVIVHLHASTSSRAVTMN